MRVLVCSKDKDTGSDFYRCGGPLGLIAKDNPGINVIFDNNPSWALIRSCHVLFMQRPCTEDFKKIAQGAKDLGVPIWVDYDDDLFSVPADNPSHLFFAKKDIQGNIREFLKAADVVTVSTDFLRRRLDSEIGMESKCLTIPNAFDDCLLPFRSNGPRSETVLWRGSPTHLRDVEEEAEAIVSVANGFPDTQFVFLGCDPVSWKLSERMPNVRRVGPLDLMTYFKTLSAMKPKIVINPLADNLFNKSKSNIAAIEAAFAGAACIAPICAEWDLPVVAGYRYGDFRVTLEKLLSSPSLCSAFSEDGWEYVNSKMRLESANKVRLNLLHSFHG